jgi:antitoxin (DNA-binding transcriptional repressor) of toxin-antitoxin stability system/virulence-associated protein VagC
MKTRIVRIGNSQGIRIPKLMLAETGLEGEIEIEVRGTQLVIRAAGAGASAIPREAGEPGMVSERMPAWASERESGGLSELLDRVATGEEIVLDRGGRPVAKLVPLPAAPRRPGRLKGRIAIGSDFDEPLPPDIAAAFRGEAG